MLRIYFKIVNSNTSYFSHEYDENRRSVIYLNWKPIIIILITFALVFALMLVYKNNKVNTTQNHGIKDQNNYSSNTIIWGVDSASYTNNHFYTCVNEKVGSPAVWGRYLGSKGNVSIGITKSEAERLHSKNIRILLINNQFENATGYKNGVNEAKQGIKLADQLGVPKGVAIFADIEPTYKVDSEFIKGYFDTMNKSKYIPGIYGVFSNEQQLTIAFSKATKENNKIMKETILWSAYPQNGITTKKQSPKTYSPQGPKGSKLLGWQYGLGAKKCNVDTNLFKGEIKEYLW